MPLEKSLVEKLTPVTTSGPIVIAVGAFVAETVVVYLAGIVVFVAEVYYRQNPVHHAPIGRLW